MNTIQSVIRFKVVDALVGNTSQYQNKRVPDGVRMFLVHHQEVPAVPCLI